MLAMDKRIAGAIESHPCASCQQGVLLFACSPVGASVARTRRGFIESVSDHHQRGRR
jgi:hypothetical protein